MNARIERLRARLPELGAASFLVTHPVNVRYLTGFESSNAAVAVGHGRLVLVTDGRYVEAARDLGGLEVVQSERDLYAFLGRRLEELADPPVAFESDHVTVAAYGQLDRSGIELVPVARAVKALRAAKEDEELEAVRRAARIVDDVLVRLGAGPLAGRSEAELAWWIERTIREEGAEDVAFDVIVASGPNAALPHHHPGPRIVGRGETVIVDLGAKVAGYCSDCTRTFATGQLPEDLRRAYAVCRSAQESALAAVRAGARARGLDAIARGEIEESGVTGVLHGLGHGVGLEVHELPVLSDTSDDVLEPGNVVTVEPGVYLPGRGGVRIEDLVVVHEEGAELLTPFTKDLLGSD